MSYLGSLPGLITCMLDVAGRDCPALFSATHEYRADFSISSITNSISWELTRRFLSAEIKPIM